MTLDLLKKNIVSSFYMVVSHWVLFCVIAVVGSAGVGAYILWGDTSNPDAVITATQKSFVQEIAVSGRVKPTESVEMTFEKTGRVSNVYVEVGSEVAAGDVLLALGSTALQAELVAARAEMNKRRIERSNEGASFNDIVEEQDTKVATAYRALLSEGLIVLPQFSSQEVDAPTVSGLYVGGVEGVYKIRIERVFRNGKQYMLSVTGIERFETEISKVGPTPLGTKGLYVEFPGDLGAYVDTSWLLDIPNPRSNLYGANYSAYQEALRERTRVVEDAQAQIVERGEAGTIADAALGAAEAEVARLEAELATYTLRAPFSGTVTAVDMEVGDTASPDLKAVTVMSADELEIESFVPEISIANVAPGDPARITLDAYGEQVVFLAYVAMVDPAETIRDGVSTYRVRLRFSEPDERVKSGMTANILITTDVREGVLSIPVGAVVYEQGSTFVFVQTKEGVDERRLVRTGQVSSLGEIEILGGIYPGEAVVVSK